MTNLRQFLAFLAVVLGLPLAFLPIALVPYGLDAIGLPAWLCVAVIPALLVAVFWIYETTKKLKMYLSEKERDNERERVKTATS